MEASAAVRDGIGAANQVFMDAFAAGDAEGVAALYTADGQLAPPNSDIVTGAEAIAAFWRQVMQMGLGSATLHTLEVDELGETAVEQGRYELGDGAGGVVDHGKYIVIWKRTDGSWKLHRDIWNSSVPAG